jgi:heme/copper-type cytochrome/quinol oxidase subunit 2
MYILTIVLSLVIILVYFSVKSSSTIKNIKSNSSLEFLWILLLTILILLIDILSITILNLTFNNKNAFYVKITANQWFWNYSSKYFNFDSYSSLYSPSWWFK